MGSGVDAADRVVVIRHGHERPEEARTHALLRRRADSTDENERRRLLGEVVELNAALARGIARRYRGRRIEPDDLEQIALAALVGAVHRYRPEEGTSFAAFAVPSIGGEVKRYFRDCAWMVRIPRRLQELQTTMAARLPDLEQELRRVATPADIADAVGADEEDIREALAAVGCFDVLSLDKPADVDAHPVFAGALVDDDLAVGRLEAADTVRSLLKNLTARQTRILQLRYVQGRTQAEIGREIGLSQIQVSRILSATVKELRGRLATS